MVMLKKVFVVIAFIVSSPVGTLIGVNGLFTDSNPRGIHPTADALTFGWFLFYWGVSLLVGFILLGLAFRGEGDEDFHFIPWFILSLILGLGVSTLTPFVVWMLLLLLLFVLSVVMTVFSPAGITIAIMFGVAYLWLRHREGVGAG